MQSESMFTIRLEFPEGLTARQMARMLILHLNCNVPKIAMTRLRVEAAVEREIAIFFETHGVPPCSIRTDIRHTTTEQRQWQTTVRFRLPINGRYLDTHRVVYVDWWTDIQKKSHTVTRFDVHYNCQTEGKNILAKRILNDTAYDDFDVLAKFPFMQEQNRIHDPVEAIHESSWITVSCQDARSRGIRHGIDACTRICDINTDTSIGRVMIGLLKRSMDGLGAPDTMTIQELTDYAESVQHSLGDTISMLQQDGCFD